MRYNFTGFYLFLNLTFLEEYINYVKGVWSYNLFCIEWMELSVDGYLNVCLKPLSRIEN